jgi:hypothetical protein
MLESGVYKLALYTLLCRLALLTTLGAHTVSPYFYYGTTTSAMSHLNGENVGSPTLGVFSNRAMVYGLSSSRGWVIHKRMPSMTPCCDVSQLVIYTGRPVATYVVLPTLLHTLVVYHKTKLT